ncbi:peptide ABC transporter substrate-binding protein [uncultured Secundilactobacillus sp.]|uniref:peptide ABC transporter substrate-binding protein n=1 Tax=uncultured Secundilactobacillus sp. TaxID=2813935 RepID=UPI00258DDAA1|nr:peptide ABC transporter substrate-binding protein [uncultured Secundilactobacillus sp.]
MWLSKKRLTTIGVASLSLLLAACSSGGSQSKKAVTMSTDAQLASMDPSKTTALGSFDMLNNTNEGLYRLGKDSKPEVGLATKMTQSKNGKHFVIAIRPNTKWSNGDTVTAKDFVYGWQRTVNPKTASQYSYLYSGIKNADAIMNSKKSPATLGIKATGKYELTVDLDQRIPYFKLLLGFPVFFPQNQKAVEKYGSGYGTRSSRMVYNGPFKLAKWNGTGNTWQLERNNQYWDKKAVKLDTVKYQVVQDNQTGLNQYNQKKLIGTALSGNQAKNLKNNKDMVVRPQSSSYYLAMNQKLTLFKNKKIRQAISMAIDRDQIVKNVLGDGSMNNGSFVSKGLATNPKTGKDFTADTKTPESMTYNLKKAQALWKQGLRETGVKNPSFTLLSSDSPAGKQVTEFLQGKLEKNLPGLKVTTQNVPLRTLLSKQGDHDYQVTLASWFADFADPITFLNILTTKNPSNNPQWSNAEYDKLIQASSTTDANNAEKRWDDMVKAQNILLEDQGVTPLYQSAAPWLMNRSLKDLVYNSAGANYNWKTAYMK